MEELRAKMTDEAAYRTERLVLPFYVEKKSGLMFEAQLFDKFVLVRLATPGIEAGLKRLSMSVFLDNYEEYEGDPDEVRRFLSSCIDESPLVITRRR